MKHLELHILQSVPFSCLNRDDLGSPKSGYFGGVKRARVSSQCWKRAVRLLAQEMDGSHFQGHRTKLIVAPLSKELEALAIEKPQKVAEQLANELGKLDEKNKLKTKTLFYTSPKELKALAQEYARTQEIKKAVAELKKVQWCDAADIALFGRMVAQDQSLTVEGASMFSHAISTHRVDSEPDFYVAVDDLQPEEESGGGMMGTLEFQSATYYRFTALNLDMLADSNHLAGLPDADRREIVRAFIRATVMSIPGAKKNSMNGNTLPVYVLGVIREKGHPIQLVNAFEKPISGGKEGIANSSVEAIEQEYMNLKTKWGIASDAEFVMSPKTNTTFEELVEGLIRYV